MDLVNETPFTYAWTVGQIRHPQRSITFVVKGTFDLRNGGTAEAAADPFLPTGDAHVNDDPERPLRYSNDFAYFKPRTDVLLVGTCHAPNGTPTPACEVKFGVGKYSKGLVVLGDRSSEDEAPQPFTQRPVIADPARQAAGFGPVPMIGPERMTKTGTYDALWQKTRWPWFPNDFDWSFFNAAPSDQQIEGYLRGDEEVFFENLHPKHPRYRCRLPGLRARCFVTLLVRASERFEEVPLFLDTLWVDTDAEKLILVWRGDRDLPDGPAASLGRLYLVSEPLGQKPKSASYYAKRLEALDVEHELDEEPEMEAVEPESEEPMPEEEPEPKEDESILRSAQQEATRAQAEAIEQIQKAGGTVPLPPPPASPSEMMAQVRKALEETQAKLTQLNRPIPPALTSMLATLPEVLPAEEEPEIEETPPAKPEDLPERIHRKESLEGADLTGAQLAGEDLSGLCLRRAILTRANLRGARLSDADLREAVLDRADLYGVQAGRASFVGADLSDADLRGANLEEADLSEADLSRARMERVRMTAANASRAILADANLTGADLERAVMEHADLSRTRLHRVRLRGARLREAKLIGAWGHHLHAEEADLTELRASEANFPEGKFRAVRADGSIWDHAKLYGCDFSKARLRKAEFGSSYLAQTHFRRADLKQARFVEASLRGADLTRANLFRADLEGADLTDAQLHQASLYEAELWKSKVEGARFLETNLRKTKLGGSHD